VRTDQNRLREIVGPSLTATVVAAIRALYAEMPEPYRVAPDEAASALVPRAFAWPARVARRGGASAAALHVGLGGASLGLTYHVALRTHAIDSALREAVGRGTRQVVLLGAGLDNRAARLGDLAGVRVFEVDHPSTQRYKAQRLRAAGWSQPAGVVEVAIDFERDRLDEALLARGLSERTPTFWIWEGVTVYLTPDAIEATLESVRKCSAPESRIALTYTRPSAIGGRSLWGVATSIARLIGEPVRGALTREELTRSLGRAGFSILSDETVFDWAERVWGRVPPGLREWERLAIAGSPALAGANKVAC
jgi:methyltransferase (TIGR00027 family)